ncbi:histidine kinase N-terminal 7TM domain-containing protein [Methanocella sp. MCL-LM]|uniref:histidine kinase N-terminal 7TM domain-containing protein n=1 Tax=Methanocella sp. MCL-LM TaxID=3412035 RepID=UPI003C70CE1A
MILQLSYYSVTMLATAIILCILAAYVWKRRSVPGGTYFSLLMALMSGWVLVSALEYSATEISTKIIFAKMAFAGGVSIPPLWLLFALEYCYPDRRVDGKMNLLLWTLPAIAAVLTVTNEYHWLIWSSILPAYSGYGDTLIFNRGIAAWAITLYSFAITTPGFLLLFWKALRTGDKNYPRPASLLLGAIIVLLLSGTSQYFLIPGYGVDLTPLALAVMGIVFAWGVFRHRIFELMPVAAEKLIENMTDGVLVLNKNGTIVKINATARRKFGVSETVVGQPADKTLSEWPLLAECLNNSGGSPAEITIGGDDGMPRWIDTRVSPLEDGSKGSLGSLIILRDITPGKQYEASLRKSEADRARAEQIAHIGYYEWDLRTKVAKISEGCARIFGFPAGTASVTYDTFIGRIHPDDADQVKTHIHTLITRGKGFSLECRIVLPDGSVRHIHSVSEAVIPDAAGVPVRQFGTVQDITDIKLADEQLKTSLREKEALLKEVHHRVKNNLQIITSLLNLQSSGMEDPKYIDLIRDSQNRIKSMALVHEYLYKSESLSNISTPEYLKSLTGNLARSYSHASGSVTLCTKIDDIPLDIDKAVPVGIIVTELVSNAFKYAFPDGRKGEIWVVLRREEDKIVLTISDNGVGLPQGFDIQKTSTLGLQLVGMLTQQLEGTLEIERAGKTLFRITIRS